MVDGAEKFVIDLPYNSQALRRFLRVARNIDWSAPLSLTVFKGKKNERGSEETGIWFQQKGETVRPYYSKEQPHGMPEPLYDDPLEQWDFRSQHRWLVERLQTETMADIEDAGARFAAPIDHSTAAAPEPDPSADVPVDPSTEPWTVSDDDVPF